MALFVFGAGATRACSFVDPRKYSCLPPLDRDFFTQLQRVANPKHQSLVKEVMKDVVELFGTNFDATMETVFTTLEHTIRMLKTTGENRAFKSPDLQKKRDRLKQAIAAVLEESLVESQRRVPRHCDLHENFVSSVLNAGDSMVTFNYDCLLDYSLKQHGNEKWNAHYGYGFGLGPRGTRFKGYDHWQPQSPATKDATVTLFKLHGSLHFHITGSEDAPKITLKQRPYTKQGGKNMNFSIIPPE